MHKWPFLGNIYLAVKSSGFQKGACSVCGQYALVRRFSHTSVSLEQRLKVKEIKSMVVACHFSLVLSVVQSETEKELLK